MAIPRTPEYSLFRQPLDTADRKEFSQRIGFIHLWRFEDASGAVVLDGEINASFGSQVDDFVPLAYNSRILFKPQLDRAVLQWAAQPGKIAVILISSDAEGLVGDNQPVKQLVSSATGITIASGVVAVGTAATQIRPSSLTRAALQIANDGAADIFVGPSTVTTANGYRIPAGASIDVDNTTAAIFGIVAAGSVNARFLEQA